LTSRIDWGKGPLVKQNQKHITNLFKSYDSAVQQYPDNISNSLEIKFGDSILNLKGKRILNVKKLRLKEFKDNNKSEI